jgi:hypothetical protein
MITAMRKIMIVLAAVIVAVGALNAKDASQIKIYLNAGHGSWGPNDRPMATIPYPMLESTGRPDTCGFYESNTNLWKILQVGATLEKMGIAKTNIKYSRVKNGPYPYVAGAADAQLYNRPLSEIAAEVEEFAGDMFLSVHSNATTEGAIVNYPVYMYRGATGSPALPESVDMGKAMWPYGWTNQLDPKTEASLTEPYIVGDISYMGGSSTTTNSYSGKQYTGYLGVMKHGTPGLLIEGYFHTYQPARHRALNTDYCHQEGIRYARGIAKYFGLTDESTGYIMGTVKDLHEKMVNSLYHYAPNSPDQWRPVNGATVTLYKNGSKVADYQVDNNYNGVFVFENLAPGDYTLDASATDYKPLSDFYKSAVTVKANETSYAFLYMEASNYVPSKTSDENYNDPVQPGYAGLRDSLNMTQEYVNKAVDVLAGKTIRRSIVRNGYVYTLAVDASGTPYLYMINPETQTVIKQLSTTGVQGTTLALSDIAFTADGVLIGCNAGENQFDDSQVAEGGSRGYFRVYKWTTDYQTLTPTGDPTEWFNSTISANFYHANMGATLAVSGTTTSCQVITTAITTGTSKAVRFQIFYIENGELSTSIRNQNAAYTATAFGDNLQLMVSPRNNSNFIIDASGITPLEFQITSDGQSPLEVGKFTAVDAASNGANYFKYAKHALMVLPYATDSKNCGVKLYDITDGLDKANLIKTTHTDLDGATFTYAMAAGLVDSLDISLYLNKDNNWSKFTTRDVAQPIVKGIMAYALKAANRPDKSYVFRFKANDDAQSAAILFNDATSGEKVGEVAVPTVKSGSNEVILTNDQIPGSEGQKMTWAVRLTGKTVPSIDRINALSTDFTYNRAAVAVNTSTESDYFGNIYVFDFQSRYNASNGVYAYTPDLARTNSTAFGGNQTFGNSYRMGIGSDGKLYLTDYYSDHSGIYVAEPSNLGGDFTQFFGGTRSGGLFTNGGVTTGGRTTSANVAGSGSKSKLYAFTSNLSVGGNYNNVAVYNIGSADSIASVWNAAPSAVIPTGASGFGSNSNVVADTAGGVWVAQDRAAGKNVESNPVLAYFKADGTLAYNSVVDTAYLNGSKGAGLAVSRDNKLLVINDASGNLCFFDITWTAGVPKLSYKYKFASGVADVGNNVYEMAFDYAGNLAVTGKYLGVFTIPGSNNATLVPAKSTNLVVKGASGVDDNLADIVLRVYPNPTNGVVNIIAPEEIKTVGVYSTSGQLVIRTASSTVDMSQLPTGIYFVKVNSLKTVKVIKK